MGGTFSNESAAQINSWTAELFETPITAHGAASVAGDANGAQIASGDATPIAFPPIVKNWQWTISGIDYVKGPLSEQFEYQVRFTLEDEVGNSYQLSSDPFTVTVEVPSWKESDAYGAGSAEAAGITAAVSGAILGIFSLGIGAGIAGAVATGFFITASSLESSAQDPPEPDEEALEEVPIHVPALPDVIAASPWGAFFDTTGHILGACAALNQVEGKLLWAVEHHEYNAIALQRASYRAIRVELMRGLVTLAETAVPNGEYGVNEEAFAATISQIVVDGLTPDQRAKLVSTGMTEEALEAFVAAVRNMRASQIPRVIQFERLARSVRGRVAFTGHHALSSTYEVLGDI
jgi:hypothetical protein